ncbi:MAG: hypothetical protein FWF59_02570 [Turicibacter sp.]|nr:hypothetical protein [Turicibacter sp.]
MPSVHEESYRIAVKLLSREIVRHRKTECEANDLTNDVTKLLDEIEFLRAREIHLMQEVQFLAKQVEDSKAHIDNLNMGLDAMDDILTAQERDNQTLRELLSIGLTAELEGGEGL